MTTITKALSDFFDQATYPVLFLGAGVSARAGLPTWRSFVEQLAEGLRSADSLTTQQMHESVADNDLTRAVEYFRLSRKMLEGDKRKLMARLLSTFDASALAPIAALPCNAFLTTNFDRSIFDAMSTNGGQTPRDYKFGDASFKQAQWESHRFVARIHGAVEVPECMILSESQFSELMEDEDYLNLLRTCFLHRNVLFLGFSFYDPAIRFVFEELNRKFGPASPGRHMALLAADSVSEFLQKANRLNIEVVNYSPANSHEELWTDLRHFTTRKPVPSLARAVTSPAVAPIEFTRRYLAACYARAQSHSSKQALRGAIAEGIVSAVLQEAAPKAVSRSDVLERIRLTLGIRGADADQLVTEALRALQHSGLSRRLRDSNGRESLVAWSGATTETNELGAAIETLVNSCVNRAHLQEGWRPDQKVRDVLTRFFNKLVTRRGWDLGAAFASGRSPESVSILSLLSGCADTLSAFDLERLTRVCEGMIQRPTAEESTILRELGRVSFALELAFQTPQSTLIEQAILPRSLYFDASVLLPAIVQGHPYSGVYDTSIQRLRNAATSGASDLKSCVSHVYLNEIITHRALAIGYAREIGKDFADYARMDALYHGVTNVNVFVGAYANTYESLKETFRDFLQRVAPYESERELRSWLEDRGFAVIDSKKGSRYVDHYQYLERAYATKLARGKKPVLIEHDALQLSILEDEAKRGENTLFVTADRALHTATSDGPFAPLTSMMLSHVALVQFIDLLLGGMTTDAGVTDLLWSSRISDQGNSVRAYFTARGLEQYDDAMALEMPQIVEKYSELAIKEIQRKGLDFETDEPRKRASAIRTLGMLDHDYMKNMSQAAQKLRGRLLD